MSYTGFIDGRQLRPGALAVGDGHYYIRPPAAVSQTRLLVHPDRAADVVDIGWMIPPDSAATDAESGLIEIGDEDDPDRYFRGTIPTGQAAGTIKSILNRGLSWEAAGDQRSERQLPAGRAVVLTYAGGSVSAGKYLVWVRVEPRGEIARA